ncbi:sodium:calcium antiporter [Candidatus Woesearchaeota archaeon]|nr:sodium:calcium antiporter [Candidatus Woesearchaeota archaeon]
MKKTRSFENLSWFIFGGAFLFLIAIEIFLPSSVVPRKALLRALLILGLSIFVMMRAASYAIEAIGHYAREAGISDYIIGFLVVSMGTSLPDLSTAFIASMAKQGQLVLGDLIGSSIMDVTVILGLTALIGRKIAVQGAVLRKTVLLVLGMVLLPLLLALNGTLSRLDGAIMIGAFILYVIILIRKEGELGTIKKQIAFKDVWQDMVVFLGCLAALLLSARWLVVSSLQIAHEFQIPTFVVGLLVIAFGTAIPELAVELKSIRTKKSGIAFGDILGSVVMNVTLILGFATMINPITFSVSKFFVPAMFLLTAVFFGTLFIMKREITWDEGIGLLLVYATFVITQVATL